MMNERTFYGIPRLCTMMYFVVLLTLIAHSFFSHADAVGAGRNSCYRKEKILVASYRRNGSSPGDIVPVGTDSGECAKENSTKNVCVPYEVTEHRIYSMAPVIVEVDIIRSCQSASNLCQRLPRLVTFYSGTTFEATVDVGMCSGLCHGNTLCLPFRSKTKSIPSPNGDRCIKITDDCACVEPSCYRVSQYEGFPEQYKDSQGNTAIRTKIIDIGKCIAFRNARCPKQYPKGRRMDTTEWPSFMNDPQCFTKRSKDHSFITSGGKNFSVRAVETCACTLRRAK